LRGRLFGAQICPHLRGATGGKNRIIMKKLIFLLTITINCLLITYHSISQPCLPGGITFSTQEQINNFQINFPNCTEIEGGVQITGNDITNLDGLNVLNSIGEYL
jgi:hypothetical protein